DFAQLQLNEPIQDIAPKMVLDGIISPRIEEMYKFIGEEIEKSGFDKQIPSGLVITGGGSLTVGMVEMGKKILGLPVRIGTPAKATGLVDEIMDPQFSSTLGLLFYGSKNIIDDKRVNKDFNRILKDLSIGNSFTKVKDLFKQFIP
ncbi:hypothetical protein HGB07_05675, partial [Candidatus Roizmanbacteria bacterium]|nr:hypothetical protein [Candidatus Roizmanbacteria bacterium]